MQLPYLGTKPLNAVIKNSIPDKHIHTCWLLLIDAPRGQNLQIVCFDLDNKRREEHDDQWVVDLRQDQ